MAVEQGDLDGKIDARLLTVLRDRGFFHLDALARLKNPPVVGLHGPHSGFVEKGGVVLADNFGDGTTHQICRLPVDILVAAVGVLDEHQCAGVVENCRNLLLAGPHVLGALSHFAPQHDHVQQQNEAKKAQRQQTPVQPGQLENSAQSDRHILDFGMLRKGLQGQRRRQGPKRHTRRWETHPFREQNHTAERGKHMNTIVTKFHKTGVIRVGMALITSRWCKGPLACSDARRYCHGT